MTYATLILGHFLTEKLPYIWLPKMVMKLCFTPIRVYVIPPIGNCKFMLGHAIKVVYLLLNFVFVNLLLSHLHQILF